MNHTPQIKKAIQFAARKHAGQLRREKEPLPYITHLFSVALLVAEDGSDDDVVSAALLHDTLEDTETTVQELATEFNDRVVSLVEDVTEPDVPSWRERKERYLSHLASADADALRIAVADKVDNIESWLEEYGREGESFRQQWIHPDRDYVWHHSEVARIARERLPGHALTERLTEVAAREREIFERP